MLTRNLIESELSLAYLQAVAARIGYSVDIPRHDFDSIDAVISAKGKICDEGKNSPKIEVQLKATFNWEINHQNQIPFKLEIKNYNDLRAETVLPRLLILLCLPKNESEWLFQDKDQLILKHCAYYLYLKNEPEVTNEKTKTVYFPANQILTTDKLKELMIKASKLEL
jgi:hypothetical protein